MNFDSIVIRKVTPSDIPHIILLMREFAAYENLSEYLTVSQSDLEKAIFGEARFVDALIAFDSGLPVAFAICFPFFSSFRGERSVYLEDIYITEKYRKQGIGIRMLSEVAKIGKNIGAVRMDFQVLSWNVSAVDFYKKHGAESNENDRHFKFADEAFLLLAGE